LIFATLLAALLPLVCNALRDPQWQPSTARAAPRILAKQRGDSGANVELVREIDLTDMGEIGFFWQLLVTRDQRLVVSDTRNHLLHVLDRKGRYSGTIGRRGRGPGEFEGTSSMWILGDTLFVYDFQLFRLNLFTEKGEFIRSESAGDLGNKGRVVGSFPNGRLAFAGINNELGGVISVGPRGKGAAKPVIDLPEGKITYDTGFPVGQTAWTDPFALRPKFQVDGARNRIIRVLPTRVTTTAATFEIQATDAKGRQLFKKIIDDKPVVVSRAIRDSLIAADVRYIHRNLQSTQWRNTTEEIGKNIRSHFPDGKFLPPVTDLVVGNDGRIWVRREALMPNTRWSVYSKDGNYEGQFILPFGFHGLWADGSTIIGRFDDGDLEPSIREYKVNRLAR
jgi:hypothetical protein